MSHPNYWRHLATTINRVGPVKRPLRGPTGLRTVFMSDEKMTRNKPTGLGPDKMGRMWDHDYTEVDFLACIMECGTQRDYVYSNPFNDYWATVDVWFGRHYPDRWEGEEPHNSNYNTGQMGFKIALWNWLGEHNGAASEKTFQINKG